MTDVVNHPGHYSKGRFTCECITITRHLTFNAGNAFKYVWRHQEKNGVEDLRKAAVYLRWAIEDGAPACLPERSELVYDLIQEHVVVPLVRMEDPPMVYDALGRIGKYSDFSAALLTVQMAIEDYERAEPVAA